MQRLAGRRIFTVGKRTYRWEDVVLAARLSGDHALLEKQARDGIACEKRLQALDEELPEDDVDAAADEWRYDHDLLAADDMEEWLGEHKLDVDDWSDYIGRALLRNRWAKELPTVRKEQRVSQKETDAVLYTETVCSGKAAEVAERLAGQAAVYERLSREAARETSCSKTELRASLKALPAAVRRDGLFKLSAKETLERAEHVACVGICMDRFLDRLAAPAAVAREVQANELEWTRFECRVVTFPDEQIAKEAVLLVREDGLPLERAAETARSSVEDVTYILEDVASPLRDRLVGAQPGQLIGPLSRSDDFVLVSVVRRTEPSPSDRTVRSRAREHLIRRNIQREIEGRVRWHERF
jgi:hypothetical protein